MYDPYISDERRTGRAKAPRSVDGKAVSRQTGPAMRRTTLLLAVLLGFAGLDETNAELAVKLLRKTFEQLEANSAAKGRQIGSANQDRSGSFY